MYYYFNFYVVTIVVSLHIYVNKKTNTCTFFFQIKIKNIAFTFKAYVTDTLNH